jgi:outer membrane protein assembly factor BamB
MSMKERKDAASRNNLRLWPGVLIAALVVLIKYVVPALAPDATVAGLAVPMLAMVGGVIGGTAIALWWLLASRAPWTERVAAVILMVGGLYVTSRLVHPSIGNGMMGMMLPFFAVPILGLALVTWAVASRRVSATVRGATLVAAIAATCGGFLLVRTGGITGEGRSDFQWRWTATPEERLLAREGRDAGAGSAATAASAPSSAAVPAAGADAAVAHAPVQSTFTAGPSAAPAAGAETKSSAPIASRPLPATVESADAPSVPRARRVAWPGFRGRDRDSAIEGLRIGTNWSAVPPVELWRRPIGPGWSSFAVSGDLVFTQEQRGEEELVSCYRLSTGEPVWRHSDPARFWESNGGAGPRATPTVHGDRVYSMGATGILNALDAATGALIWTRNAAADTGKQVPDWGIAGSPLVIDDLVIVAVAGQLAAYESRTGTQRWTGEPGGGGYSSPHLLTSAGIPHVVLLRGARTIGVAPADGSLLWEHRGDSAVSIVQPAVIEGGDILVTSGGMGGSGILRVSVTPGEGGWRVEERWSSRGLKPYFNDFVVHKGHAYGFDGSILAAIDLADGARAWKGGRYGHGQMMLLADQDLLLVLSEDGELALVEATPEKHREIARFRAFEGKTWNHPAIAGDILLVRNGEEMVAFRLPSSDR